MSVADSRKNGKVFISKTVCLYLIETIFKFNNKTNT